MKLLHALQLAILAGIQSTVTAVPVKDPGEAQCNPIQEHRNVKSSQSYAAAPELASSLECRSDSSDTCTLDRTVTFSKTTTWSVSIAGFPGLNIGEVASAALSAGFSYSWAQTKATGSTASITCPKGVTCGIVATAWVIKTTGQVRYSYSGNEGCPQTTEWADFEVTAPYIDVPDASPGMQAKMVFSGCVDTCGNVCTDSMKKGLPMCADLTGQIKNDLQPTPADGISLGPS